MKSLNEIYDEMSIEELGEFLRSFNISEVASYLESEFMLYSYYKNLEEWNKAVRLCECFTIIGWGNKIPVEAQKSKFFNGNPYTGFYDKDGAEHHRGAIWSKRKNGYTIEPDRVFDEKSQKKEIEIDILDGKFASQRNWIFKNPIKPYIFLRNAFDELEFIQKKVLELKTYLNEHLDSSNYGTSLNYLSISVNVSSQVTEYEIVSEKTKKSYAFGKIKTPKFRFNRFTKKDGIYSIDYYIPKEFGSDSEVKQIENLKKDMLTILSTSSEKLKRKCPNFQFKKLETDCIRLLEDWK